MPTVPDTFKQMFVQDVIKKLEPLSMTVEWPGNYPKTMPP